MTLNAFASFAALAAGIIALAACDRNPRAIELPPMPPSAPTARLDTFETHELKRELDLYAAQPSLVQASKVEEAFAEIDGEIAELTGDVARKAGAEREEAVRKLADLSAYRDAEKARFISLRAMAPLPINRDPVIVPGPTPRSDALEQVGDTVEDTADRVGEEIKDAAKAIRDM